MKNIFNSPVTTFIGMMFICVALGFLLAPFGLDTYFIFKGKKVVYDLQVEYKIPSVLVIIGILLIVAPDTIVKIITGFLKKKEYIDREDEVKKSNE
jgi:cell division protein FtsB